MGFVLGMKVVLYCDCFGVWNEFLGVVRMGIYCDCLGGWGGGV
jgi:hypothetical protein